MLFTMQNGQPQVIKASVKLKPHYLYPGFNCTVKCEIRVTRQLQCRATTKAHLLTDFFGATLPLKLFHSLT